MKRNFGEHREGTFNAPYSIRVDEETAIRGLSSVFYTKDQVLSKIKTAWDKIEKLNEQISTTDDSSLKSILIGVKNDISKEFYQYSSDRANDIGSELSRTGHDAFYRDSKDPHLSNPLGWEYQMKSMITKQSKEETEKLEKYWSELKEAMKFYRDESMKFWKVLHNEEIKNKTDRELIDKYYGSFRNSNTYEIQNDMLDNVKNIYISLQESINIKLKNIGIDEESIERTWISVEKLYDNCLESCTTQYKKIHDLQQKIVSSTNFHDAQALNFELTQAYPIVLDHLKFITNQVTNHFIAEGIRISKHEPLSLIETNSLADELKNDLKEKLDQQFLEQDIGEVFKGVTMQLCKSQYDQHMQKADNIGKSMNEMDKALSLCDNIQFNEYKSYFYSKKDKYQEIDLWKSESKNLLSDIGKQATIFMKNETANELQISMSNKIEDLELENKNLLEKLKIQEDRVKEQKETIEDQKDTIKDLRSDKQEYKEKVESLNKEKVELKEINNKLNEKFGKLEEKNHSLEETNISLVDKLANFEDKSYHLEDNNHKLKEMISRLEGELEAKDKSLKIFAEMGEAFKSLADDMNKKQKTSEKETWKINAKNEIKDIKYGLNKGWEEDKIIETYTLPITKNKIFKITKFFEEHNHFLMENGNESDVITELGGDTFELA